MSYPLTWDRLSRWWRAPSRGTHSSFERAATLENSCRMLFTERSILRGLAAGFFHARGLPRYSERQ